MFKKTTEQFIADANKVHNKVFDYSLSIYNGSKIPIKIKCPNGHIFEQKPNDHLNGFGCRICSGWGNLINNKGEFEKRAKEIHGNKYDYSKSIYENHDKPLIIICYKHGEFIQSPKCHLVLKHGCIKCKNEILNQLARNKAFDKNKFIKLSTETHGNKYDYSKVNYFNMVNKVEIICYKHGSFFQSPKCHINQNQGCPKCKISKGEIKILNFLENNNIKYIHQHSFPLCKNKRILLFDFYLPNYNLCIEFDGIQHNKSIKIFGGEEGFKYIQYNDKIKNKFCLKNNIKLIRIKYNQNIEKILTKQLL